MGLEGIFSKRIERSSKSCLLRIIVNYRLAAYLQCAYLYHLLWKLAVHYNFVMTNGVFMHEIVLTVFF